MRALQRVVLLVRVSFVVGVFASGRAVVPSLCRILRRSHDAVVGSLMDVRASFHRKLFVIHVPAQAQRLEHALHRAESATRTSRFILTHRRPDVAVRHERRDRQNVRLRFSFPNRGAVVHDDGELSRKVRAARL